jgi:ribosome-associated protein
VSIASISSDELHFEFFRASGPGGQNVNKVSSAVRLRFDVRNSPSLSADVKDRLFRVAAGRITEAGVLIIEARRHRTQEQNRADAVNRLMTWIDRACRPPRPRRATRPTAAARERRLETKKRRSATKSRRSAPADE